MPKPAVDEYRLQWNTHAGSLWCFIIAIVCKEMMMAYWKRGLMLDIGRKVKSAKWPGVHQSRHSLLDIPFSYFQLMPRVVHRQRQLVLFDSFQWLGPPFQWQISIGGHRKVAKLALSINATATGQSDSYSLMNLTNTNRFAIDRNRRHLPVLTNISPFFQ